MISFILDGKPVKTTWSAYHANKSLVSGILRYSDEQGNIQEKAVKPISWQRRKPVKFISVENSHNRD